MYPLLFLKNEHITLNYYSMEAFLKLLIKPGLGFLLFNNIIHTARIDKH